MTTQQETVLQWACALIAWEYRPRPEMRSDVEWFPAFHAEYVRSVEDVAAAVRDFYVKEDCEAWPGSFNEWQACLFGWGDSGGMGFLIAVYEVAS